MTRASCIALAALSTSLCASTAHAFDSSKLEFERTLENVNAPGLYHVEVDADLWRHARRDDLGDLRIVGPGSVEVPWLVRRVPPSQQPQPRAVSILEPAQLDGGGAQATLDFGPSGQKHSQIALAVDAPPGDWLRRARVEQSADGRSWTLVVEGGYVFRVTAAGHVGSDTTIKYPTSTARWLRVTLLPPPTAPLPTSPSSPPSATPPAPPSPPPPVRIVGATAAYVPPEAHALLRLLPSQKPQPVPEPGDAATTSWLIDLGSSGVPITELALDVGDAAFARRALLAAGSPEHGFAPVATTLVYRAAPAATGALAEENLRVPAAGARARWLRLSVYNGAAEALVLRAVSPAYAADELVFRAPGAGSYTLFVGGSLPAPSYPLADELARTHEQPKLAANFGTITPNPLYGHLEKPRPPQSAPSRTLPLVLGIALLVVAVVVSALWRRRRA